MNNSASEHNFIYSESEDEDAVKEISKAEDDGNDSDSSKHSNDNRQQSKPSSVNPAWPQSYRSLVHVLFYSVQFKCSFADS